VVPGERTSSVLWMTDFFKVVRKDDGRTSVMGEPRPSFKTQTQAM